MASSSASPSSDSSPDASASDAPAAGPASSNEALGQDAWEARIGPLLPVSLRDASDRITQTPAVQKWLHAASFEAADGLGQMDPMQAESEGYWRMMDGLKEHFPNLVAAVDALTEGCASLDLHWRPLSPSFTRVYVRTTGDRDSDVLVRLDALDPSAVRSALDTLADALPAGDPFPNRPHEVTATVVYDGRCLTVRVREQVREGESGGTRRSVVLLRGPSSSDPFPLDKAVRAIRAFFQADV